MDQSIASGKWKSHTCRKIYKCCHISIVENRASLYEFLCLWKLYDKCGTAAVDRGISVSLLCTTFYL